MTEGYRGDWTAVVLAGGRSARMGADKLSIDVEGMTTLERILRDLADVPVVVVGPETTLPSGLWGSITVVQEEPPYSGPAAAVDAALPHVGTEVAAVIAGDMPLAAAVASDAVRGLPPDADACVPVDADGWRQTLCAAYRCEPLRQALADEAPLVGRSMRAIVDRLAVVEMAVTSPGIVDVDTPSDVEAAARAIATVRAQTDHPGQERDRLR